jgi:hypothetical protein
MDYVLLGSGGRSLVSVLFLFYSVIVQLLFLVHILILLIVFSFPTFPSAHLPLRSVRLSIQCQPPQLRSDPPDFNRHRTLAAAALTYLQF